MSYFHYIGFLLFHFCCVSGFTSSRRHISVMPTASRHHAPPTALSAERRISVEYCTGCRWMLRSAWMAQELLTTFEDDLDSVTLIPSRIKPGGVFTVRGNEQVVLWDRKEQGGFPESKELKQKVRDLMAPERNLGHSEGSTSTVTKKEDCVDCPTPPAVQDTYNRIVIPEPHVAITYCTGCRWLLRGAWYAQELLTTFDAELNAVTLIPSRPDDGAQGGTFRVQLNGELLWDRASKGGFPETKELKQMIRDRISPSRDLGHSDKKEVEIVTMNDDEAEDMRKFFGVM